MGKKRRTRKEVISAKKKYNGANIHSKIEAQIINYNETGLLNEITNCDFKQFENNVFENCNTWFNVHGLHEEQIVEQIGNLLNLDSLVIQNILDTTIRPKVQEYDDYLFFSIKSIDNNSSHLQFEQISFILSQNYLLSFQEKRGDHFGHIRERIRQNTGMVCKMKHDYLQYLMLEAILDSYYIELDRTYDIIEKYDYNSINKNPKIFNIEAVEMLKATLNQIKRSLNPIREFLMIVEKTEHKVIHAENRKYFVDLKDHTNILLEEVDYQYKNLETTTNIFFSLQSQKLNEIMKMLTIISSIFIPITFIAGVYGMNFDYMPELRSPNGYFIVLGVMLLLVLGPIIYFKKKNWF